MLDKELGTIIFKQNARARRMSIRILRDSLHVSLPYGFTEKDGLKFIEEVREKLKTKQTKINKKTLLLTDESVLETLTFKVQLQKAERKNLYSSLKSGILTIEYPTQLNCEDTRTQEYFWNSINYFLRNEAKRILPVRTKELALQFGFSFTDVKIQSSKSRWGSCNTKKNINLSYFLLLLPIHLVDYVILHELCHTKEMNHDKKFWEWMDEVTFGKSKTLRKELKEYSIPK